MSSGQIPMFVYTRQPVIERQMILTKMIDDEFHTIHAKHKKQEKKERIGTFNRYEKKGDSTTSEIGKDAKKQGKKSKFSWYMIGGIILVIGIVAALQMRGGEEDYVIRNDLEKIDYYNVLGIKDKKIASEKIPQIYRKMVLKWHPDRNPQCGGGDSDLCVKKMSDINMAYKVLMNKEARTFHDKFGVRPPEEMIRGGDKAGGKNQGNK